MTLYLSATISLQFPAQPSRKLITPRIKNIRYSAITFIFLVEFSYGYFLLNILSNEISSEMPLINKSESSTEFRLLENAYWRDG